jgi:hypothetical protein
LPKEAFLCDERNHQQDEALASGAYRTFTAAGKSLRLVEGGKNV